MNTTQSSLMFTPSKIVFSGLFCLSTFSLLSQEVKIENIRATQEGEISFDYTVQPSHSQRERYDVEIFTSADNFKTPLNIPLRNIPVGVSQNVRFTAAEHLPLEFDGALRIRLKAEATVYPIQVTDYSKKVKQGSSVSIRWEDPNNQGPYDVIVEGAGQTSKLAENLSTMSYTGTLPENVSKGKYQIKVMPTKKVQSVSDDLPLAVAGKMGVGMKILGGVAAAGVGILAASGSGGEPGGTSNNNLPGPPDTPDN